MRGPGLAGFRLDVGEPGPGGRIGNVDEMLAAGTLNLPAGEMRFALDRLVAVRTVKLEFGCVHRFYLHKRKSRGESMSKLFSILFTDGLRLIW